MSKQEQNMIEEARRQARELWVSFKTEHSLTDEQVERIVKLGMLNVCSCGRRLERQLLEEVELLEPISQSNIADRSHHSVRETYDERFERVEIADYF